MPPKKSATIEYEKVKLHAKTRPDSPELDNFYKKLDRLEAAPIAGAIKEMMVAWTHANIPMPKSRKQYLEKVRKSGDAVSIDDLFMGMTEVYVDKHPEYLEKSELARSKAVLADFYASMTANKKTPNYPKIKKVIDEMKLVMG